MRRIAGKTSIAFAFACALCIMTGATAAQAQWFRGAAYLSAGVTSTETGGLDDLLAARGYPRFGRSAAQIGIGGYATVANRFMFGAEWTGFIKGSQNDANGREVYLGGGSGTLGVGYAVNVSPRLRVYPRIGVGVGGLGLTFDTAEDTIAFDDVLSDPDGEADASRGFQPTLSHEHGVIDIGGGAEFMPNRNGRGTFVGIRLGHVIGPSDTEWEFNHRAVRNGPEASGAGPYLRVTIGAAGWR